MPVSSLCSLEAGNIREKVMTRKTRIFNIVLLTIVAIAVIILIWSTMPSKAQAIETVPGQLIKVYETKIPYYEYLSDEGRKCIRICFVGQVYEYGNDCNTIEDFFRLAFKDDMRFNDVVLLVAYLNLQRNQLIFFYIYEDWLVHIKPTI